jgi:hypothetical protein
MLKERVFKFDYQCRTSVTFDLQLKRVSKFRDRKFALMILEKGYTRENTDIEQENIWLYLDYFASVSQQNLGTRSGLFSNISKGDAVHMKSLLDYIVQETWPTGTLSTSFKNHKVANADADITPLVCNKEEPIKCEEGTGDINSSCWFMKLIHQIHSVFYTNANDTFLESNFFLFERDTISTEEKRLQDFYLVAIKSHNKKLKKINEKF